MSNEQRPSMLCLACNAYTLEYSAVGLHTCGNEVISGADSVPLDYEGEAHE